MAKTGTARTIELELPAELARFALPEGVDRRLHTLLDRQDRGDKWDAYQRLTSLTDYLLVSQQSATIEHYHREDDGSWRYRRLDAGASFVVRDGAPVTVDAVYEGAFVLDGD